MCVFAVCACLCVRVCTYVCVCVQPRLDYIDYDTKDHNFNALVPKLYQTMEVLFNYKRTVEDFKRCGTKVGRGQRTLDNSCG